MVALLHATLRLMREIDAAVSKKAVFFVYIWEVGTARGFFIVTNVCGLTNICYVIFYFPFTCWFALSFPVWCVPKSHVCSAAAHGIVVGCPLLVVGVVPGRGEI